MQIGFVSSAEVEELVSKELFTAIDWKIFSLFNRYKSEDNKQHKDLMIDFFQRMQHKGINQKTKSLMRILLTDAYLKMP